MAGKPTPLPTELSARPFLTAEAIALGVSPSRLRASDLRSLGKGIFVRRNLDLTPTAVSAARARNWNRGVLGGISAAQTYGFPLPNWLNDSEAKAPTTLCFPHGAPLPVAASINAVRTTLRPEDTRLLNCKVGLPPTQVRAMTRGRTWLSLAPLVPFEFLVAIADHLLRVPRPSYEQGRRAPFSTVDSLAAMLEAHPRVRGVARARKALALARVGADSVQETRARLAFHAAKLPEPELNVPIRDFHGAIVASPDFMWRKHGVVAEYDGSHHRALERFTADRDKDALYRSLGLTVVRIFAPDLAPVSRAKDEKSALRNLAGSRAVRLVAAALDTAQSG